ncbi:hypothetical protein F2P56_020503, partial [Juglans regia]
IYCAVSSSTLCLSLSPRISISFLHYLHLFSLSHTEALLCIFHYPSHSKNPRKLGTPIRYRPHPFPSENFDSVTPLPWFRQLKSVAFRVHPSIQTRCGGGDVTLNYKEHKNIVICMNNKFTRSL